MTSPEPTTRMAAPTGAEGTVLTERAVVRAAGGEAGHFLHNLLTADIASLAVGAAAYGALLTPQGKIVADMLVFRETDTSFLLDVAGTVRAELLKRLTLYKLRADVALEPLDEAVVVAVWGEACEPAIARLRERGALVASDPRLGALGARGIAEAATAASLTAELAGDEAGYHAHRIALGVPEGGIDFAFGDTFAHDADLDQLHGVDFRKGCYIGQEIVSRMQHRGTARRRIVMVRADTALPASGTELIAAGRGVGGLGSVDGRRGLALVRIDRVAEARAAGTPVEAGAVAVELAIPPWAGFTWPAVPAPERTG